MTTNEERRSAVYIPFKTLLTSIEALEQGMPPDKIDTSVWSSLSGGVRAQVWSGYKFLGLIDNEGNIQPALSELVTDKANRNKHLADLIRRCYSNIVTAAEKNSTQAQFEETMRGYNVQGETLEKAIRFYLQAAGYLKLPVSTLWKKSGERRKSAPPRRRRATNGTKGQDEPLDGSDNNSEEDEGDALSINLVSGGRMVLTVTASIVDLSKEDRDFAFEIIDKMKAYEREQKGPKASIDGKQLPAVMEQPNLTGGAVN